MVRFLVLCHTGDRTALHVGAALRRRHGTEAVQMVSSQELELAPHWSHWHGGAVAATTLRLADGVELCSDQIGVVFNRLLSAQAPHFQTAGAGDHNYAVMELYALWLSWLESLPCAVMNHPSVWGLGTQRRSHAEWLVLAGAAGLPVTRYRFTTDPRRFGERDGFPHRRLLQPDGGVRFEPIPAHLVGRRPCVFLDEPPADRCGVLVAGDNVVGPIGERFAAPLGRLRVTAGLDLFEVAFDLSAPEDGRAEWRMSGLDPFPRCEDPARVLAIVTMLETAAAGGQAPS